MRQLWEKPVQEARPVKTYTKGSREAELAEALRVNRMLCGDMRRLLTAYETIEKEVEVKPIDSQPFVGEWTEESISALVLLTDDYELRAKTLRKQLEAVKLVSNDAANCRMQFRFVSLVRKA
jgi:hypothetical protein